jgi:hypothetical protein
MLVLFGHQWEGYGRSCRRELVGAATRCVFRDGGGIGLYGVGAFLGMMTSAKGVTWNEILVLQCRSLQSLSLSGLWMLRSVP